MVVAHCITMILILGYYILEVTNSSVKVQVGVRPIQVFQPDVQCVLAPNLLQPSR